MGGKRGRPAKTNTTITINDLSIEFISKKKTITMPTFAISR